MYPYQCQTGTSGSIKLLSAAGQLIDQTKASDEIGFGYIYQTLQPGNYKIQILGVKYASDAVRDYTVSIYAQDKIKISDAASATRYTEEVSFKDGSK